MDITKFFHGVWDSWFSYVLDPRAYDRYPSSSSHNSRPIIRKCNLLDKVITDRNEVSDFCTCNNCTMQPTARESICCREVLESSCMYAANMKEIIGNHCCICKVPRVRAIVFGYEDLDLFHRQNIFLRQKAGLPVSTRIIPSDPQRHRRFAAYSKLTLFIHGVLGMSNRIELPSCLVAFIRAQYPNKSGNYTGFRDPFYDNYD